MEWIPTLPRNAWLALSADTLSAVGSGMTLPFLMVYLDGVRGMGLGVAGAALSTTALAGLVGNPVGGAWVDRSGPRRVLAAGWAIAAVGTCGFAMASQPWHAFTAAVTSGIGVALAWPAQDALLAKLVPARNHSGVFAMRHATLNLGLGVGAFGAALLVDIGRPDTFVFLYLLDAASFTLAAVLLTLVRSPASSPPAPIGSKGEEAGIVESPRGYRAVARDRLFVRVWVLLVVLVAVGFSQLNSAFPVYMTQAGMSAGSVGWAFAANAVTVMGAQLVVLRFARGRRRTAAIRMLCGLWALAWVLMLVVVTGHFGAGAVVALVVLAAVIFSFGETLFSPTVPALINSIASEALRGRYNGAAAFAYTVGFAAGPALAGALLQHQLGIPLLGGLIVGCGVAGVLTVSIRRDLPVSADLIDPPTADGGLENNRQDATT
ncbi:MFS transporter [Streptomyces chartreusis]|uniref:MFS transporter n=1 Tax=Streptomyces chartreusis TaxID=1969 RepID=UPI003828DDB4